MAAQIGGDAKGCFHNWLKNILVIEQGLLCYVCLGLDVGECDDASCGKFLLCDWRRFNLMAGYDEQFWE